MNHAPSMTIGPIVAGAALGIQQVLSTTTAVNTNLGPSAEQWTTIIVMTALSIGARLILGRVEDGRRRWSDIVRESLGIGVLTLGIGFLLHSRVVSIVLDRFGVPRSVGEDPAFLFFIAIAAAAAGVAVMRRVLLRAASRTTNLPFDEDTGGKEP